MSRLSDSDRGPTLYESAALPTELRRQTQVILPQKRLSYNESEAPFSGDISVNKAIGEIFSLRNKLVEKSAKK